ncbi:MAG: hypothetical protein DLM67_02685 [Candidatus Nephthysia bennettiae]|uniref:Uncharacterized protein n=1 Tax=Candidatus Nephthysia bennettiae TaxID=3127016 RepID=A0A934K2H8_9BACT|nr:hypothetical protein [Candidatus Dormibacteraeota bacterium]MBJ7614935.1 hypothetical protein [Candidatus Dormibacteraeota bacterium]PZR99951.1 MAG: hypothetical protein DLM67_02685 [Candidatus Dormibacteraeota bacterium]
MAKVPLVPVWMKEEFEDWGRPDGPEPVAPTEEENILIAEALADEWNGRTIPIEVVERQVRNRLRREKRRRLKEAEAAAKLEAEAKAGVQAPGSGSPEPAGVTTAATPPRAPRRPKTPATAEPGAAPGSPGGKASGARSGRTKRSRVEIGREQLGLR